MLTTQWQKDRKKFLVGFSPTKLQNKTDSVKFMVHIFDEDHVRPNKEYVETILAL